MMLDEQIRRIIDKTFHDVDVLIREVQEERRREKNKRMCCEPQRTDRSLLAKENRQS